MKYERPTFQAGIGSKEYRENFDRIFAPKKAAKAVAPKTPPKGKKP